MYIYTSHITLKGFSPSSCFLRTTFVQEEKTKGFRVVVFFPVQQRELLKLTFLFFFLRDLLFEKTKRMNKRNKSFAGSFIYFDLSISDGINGTRMCRTPTLKGG